MDWRDTIQTYIRSHRSVSLKRIWDEQRSWYGYLLACSHDLVLMQTVEDFKLYELQVFRLGDLKEIAPDNPFREMMLQKEGVRSATKLKPLPDISNWHSLVNDITQRFPLVIAECENPERELFLIGPILPDHSSRSAVALQYFHVDGEWETRASYMPFINLTRMKLDSPYLRAYRKYLTPAPEIVEK